MIKRSSVKLRRATPNDTAALVALYREICRWLLTRGNWQWRDERFTADALRRDIRCVPILVATVRDRIVGAVYLQWRRPRPWPDRPGSDALYVRRLVIARRVAGQGVADALLRAVSTIARRAHRPYVRLTSAPLAPMARIYHRLGFTLIDEVDTGPYSVFRFERSRAPFAPSRGR